jgi:TRAP transporter TAXI family solute receptor
MKKKVCVALILSLVLLPLFAGGKQESASGTMNPNNPSTFVYPRDIRMATAGMTAGTTVLLMGMAPQFEKIIGSTLRAVPTDILLTQCLDTKLKKADVWNVHIASAYRPTFGVEEYCTTEWGPQRLRAAWLGGPVRLTIITRADAGIKTIPDLKGKRLAVYPGSHGFFGAYLAFGGLTLNDCVSVPASGFGESNRMVLEKNADGCLAGITEPTAMEMAQTPSGVYYIEFPHSDTAGWARLQAIYPALGKYKAPQGVGVKEAWGKELSGFARGMFVYADQGNHISYGIAKVAHKGYDDYKSAHAELPEWTLEAALDVWSVPLPYHEGTIMYFKEIGAWTDKHEAWQKNQLRLENLRVQYWDDAVKEAKAKGLKIDKDNKEWTDLWKTYLAKIK